MGRQLICSRAREDVDMAVELDAGSELHLLESFPTLVTEHQPRNVYIMIDNLTRMHMDQVNEFCHSMKHFENCYIVLLSLDARLSNECHFVSSMNFDHVSTLAREKFNMSLWDVSDEELYRLLEASDGVPLAVVCALMHIKLLRCDLDSYFDDINSDNEFETFSDYEPKKTFREVLRRDIEKVKASLSKDEWNFLKVLSYLGDEKLAVDVLAKAVRNKLKVSVSKIVDVLLSLSLAEVGRDNLGRCVTLHNDVIELLHKMDENCMDSLDSAITGLNSMFTKTVRLRNTRQAHLQIRVMQNFVSLKKNLIDKLCYGEFNFWMKLSLCHLHNIAGHCCAQVNQLLDSQMHFVACMEIFGEIFLGANNLQMIIQRNDNVEAFVTQTWDCIQTRMSNMSDSDKIGYRKILSELLYFRTNISADLVCLWKDVVSNSDWQRYFNERPNDMSREKYRCLEKYGLAKTLESEYEVFPFELLVSMMYSYGRLHFYECPFMPKILAKTLFTKCDKICYKVKEKFGINILYGLLCKIKGSANFLIYKDNQLDNCCEAVNLYEHYAAHNEKYYEFGICMKFPECLYTRVIIIKQILKARTLIISNILTTDQEKQRVSREILRDIMILEDAINQQSLKGMTLKRKVSLAIAAAFLQFSNPSLMQKGLVMMRQICGSFAAEASDMQSVFQRDWGEALHLLLQIQRTGRFTEACYCPLVPLCQDYVSRFPSEDAERLLDGAILLSDRKSVPLRFEAVDGEYLHAPDRFEEMPTQVTDN